MYIYRCMYKGKCLKYTGQSSGKIKCQVEQFCLVLCMHMFKHAHYFICRVDPQNRLKTTVFHNQSYLNMKINESYVQACTLFHL